MPSFSRGLEKALHQAMNLARERNHEFATLEHLLLALTDDRETIAVLTGCDVDIDDKGFVITGRDASLPLQTSVPGVFAIGDVRAGSVKRVGGAIGEGAAVVSQIHARLG